MINSKIVSRDEWLAARLELLEREKAFTRERDALSRRRRELPRVRIDKSYRFATNAGEKDLAGLFGDRSQLIVYHFMFGPDWDEGCPSCSFWADNFDGIDIHLAHRDITLIAVSRTSLDKINAYRERMGWRFEWVSSLPSDFNRDFHVSFTTEEIENERCYYNYRNGSYPVDEAHGISVFYRDDDGEIFHTYSCYARGVDMLNGAYHFMDLAPKGRDEDALEWSMDWLERHDQYD